MTDSRTLWFLSALLAASCSKPEAAANSADAARPAPSATPSATNPAPSATPSAAPSDVDAAKFKAKTGIDLTGLTVGEAGLAWKDVVVGTGDSVKVGQTLAMKYTGWLTDGTIFDQTKDGDPPLEFSLGGGQVIPGWDGGIQGMRVKGKRLLVIPAALGYGPQGSGPIPPNATLVFSVEVVGAR